MTWDRNSQIQHNVTLSSSLYHYCTSPCPPRNFPTKNDVKGRGDAITPLLAGGLGVERVRMKWPKENCNLNDTGNMTGGIVAFPLIYLSTYVSDNRF